MSLFKKKNITRDVKEDAKNSHSQEVQKFLSASILNPESEEEYGRMFLSGLARKMEIVQAVFLRATREESRNVLVYLQGYACPKREPEDYRFEEGEGFPGQVLKDQKILYIENVPENYLSIKTGLGEAKPNNLAVVPVFNGNELFGVLELATFRTLSPQQKEFLEAVSTSFDPGTIKKAKNEKQTRK